MNFKVLTLVAFTALLMATLAQAQSGGGEVKLTMDEVPFQPINGLTVKGVTFHDTGGANYNAGNGGLLTWTQDPVIEGPSTDVVTIDFPYAVQDFQVGVALSTTAAITNAVSVDLIGPGGVALGTFTANAASLGSFDNTLFVSPSNVGPIVQAVFHFDPNAGRFALDNLTFSLYNYLFSRLLGS